MKYVEFFRTFMYTIYMVFRRTIAKGDQYEKYIAGDLLSDHFQQHFYFIARRTVSVNESVFVSKNPPFT